MSHRQADERLLLILIVDGRDRRDHHRLVGVGVWLRRVLLVLLHLQLLKAELLSALVVIGVDELLLLLHRGDLLVDDLEQLHLSEVVLRDVASTKCLGPRQLIPRVVSVR